MVRNLFERSVEWKTLNSVVCHKRACGEKKSLLSCCCVSYVMEEKIKYQQANLFSEVLKLFEKDPEGSSEDLTKILTVYLKMVGQMGNLHISYNKEEAIHRIAVQRVRSPYSVK